MKTRLTAISFALAVVAAIYLLVEPVYSGFSNGRPTRATLIEINGDRVIVPVMFPAVVALASLIVRRQKVRIVAAIVMGVFVFISGMSIGLFYLPAGVLLLLAACVGTRRGCGIFGEEPGT